MTVLKLIGFINCERNNINKLKHSHLLVVVSHFSGLFYTIKQTNINPSMHVPLHQRRAVTANRAFSLPRGNRVAFPIHRPASAVAISGTIHRHRLLRSTIPQTFLFLCCQLTPRMENKPVQSSPAMHVYLQYIYTTQETSFQSAFFVCNKNVWPPHHNRFKRIERPSSLVDEVWPIGLLACMKHSAAGGTAAVQ